MQYLEVLLPEPNAVWINIGTVEPNEVAEDVVTEWLAAGGEFQHYKGVSYRLKVAGKRKFALETFINDQMEYLEGTKGAMRQEMEKRVDGYIAWAALLPFLDGCCNSGLIAAKEFHSLEASIR